MARGGYRKPAQPAPVSGPGAMSQRTDGQPARYMAGGEYGEGQELMELQTSAPMSNAPSPTPSRARKGAAPSAGGMSPPALFAPTERPDEPITAGAPFGTGAGPANAPRPRTLTSTLEKLVDYDYDGSVSVLLDRARRRGW